MHSTGNPPIAHPRVALETYRGLRAGTVVVILLIAVAQIDEYRVTGDVAQSISGSFYTSVHAVFVGALFATGTCLIIYRGNSDREDSVLNFAGFMAFFVAVVPTQPMRICAPADPAGTGFTALPGCQDYDRVLSTGLAALVTVWIVAELGYFGFVWRTRGFAAYTTPLRFTRLAISALLVVYFCAPVGLNDVLHLPWGEEFLDNRHNVAAILMFLGIIAVVGLNGWSARTLGLRSNAFRYLVIGVVMIVTVILVAAFHLWNEQWFPGWKFQHDLLVLEWALILEFAAFWIIQSIELWNVDTRDALPEAEPKQTVPE